MDGKKSMTPYSRVVVMAVLGFVMGLPGGYYGYEVVRAGSIIYVAEFDKRYHRVEEVYQYVVLHWTDINNNGKLDPGEQANTWGHHHLNF